MSDDLIAPDLLTSADDEQVLEVLTDRIGELLARQPDYLMSMLYRLDVSEQAVRSALNDDQHPAQALAQLVLQRQRQRLATKKKYKQEPLDEF